MLDPQLREIINTSTKNFKAYDRVSGNVKMTHPGN